MECRNRLVIRSAVFQELAHPGCDKRGQFTAAISGGTGLIESLIAVERSLSLWRELDPPQANACLIASIGVSIFDMPTKKDAVLEPIRSTCLCKQVRALGAKAAGGTCPD